jgi:hypothetical protein
MIGRLKKPKQMKQVADMINKCAIIRHLPDSNDKNKK